jgi:DNA-binding MarR family transcriptional regulator
MTIRLSNQESIMKKKHRPPNSRPAPASRQSIDRLLRENLFLFFRARAIGDRMFSRVGQTAGKVSLMRSVYEEGPQGVAQIARARPVARQGVQRMADELAADGLVEFAANPAHLRSRLVRLTPAGRKLLESIEGGVALWPRDLRAEFNQREVDLALDVTRRLREFMLRVEESMKAGAEPRKPPRRTRTRRQRN